MHRLPSTALGIAALLALGACSGATRSRMFTAPAVPVPAAWSSVEATDPTLPAADAATLVAWWQHFNDPMLSELIAEAMRANTTVNGARARLDETRAQRDVAAAALWPSLSATASVQRSATGGHSNDTSYAAELDARWVPDVFGVNRHAVRAADYAASASAASLGDVQVLIASDVALDYILLRSAQARLAIARANLAIQEETLQITRWREQAGLVTTLAVEQAVTATEQTRSSLPLLQSSIDQTLHALAVLVGRPPAALNVRLVNVVPVPVAMSELALSFPADTLRQRADVRAAELQSSAALARVGQVRAARWPAFALSGSLGTSALQTSALGDSASVVSSLLAAITAPILDGGARRATVRAQQAALEQAQQLYGAAILSALQEVEDALVSLRDDRLRLASLHLAATAAASAAQLARQRFSSGLVDFQTVLDTQRSEFSAEDNEASATAAVSADHVRLYHALGGGWNASATP